MPGFNGFPNRETWLVNLHLSQDEVSYKKFRTEVLNNNSRSVAKDLRKYFEVTIECSGVDVESDLFADRFVTDAMNVFLSNVDWEYLSRNLIKSAELEFMR
jgi:hypothetical protein